MKREYWYDLCGINGWMIYCFVLFFLEMVYLNINYLDCRINFFKEVKCWYLWYFFIIKLFCLDLFMDFDFIYNIFE